MVEVRKNILKNWVKKNYICFLLLSKYIGLKIRLKAMIN